MNSLGNTEILGKGSEFILSHSPTLPSVGFSYHFSVKGKEGEDKNRDKEHRKGLIRPTLLEAGFVFFGSVEV